MKTFKFGTTECVPTEKPHVFKRVQITVKAETINEARLLAVPQVREGERIIYWFEDRPLSKEDSDDGVSGNVDGSCEAGRDEGSV